MTEATSPQVELDALIGLFYPRAEELGSFMHCTSEQCPPHYRALLDHEKHMTVTVEHRHGQSVDVDVLSSRQDDTHYVRQILLRRQSDRRVVQFGIVRLALDAIATQVRDQILAQHIPLGRVLIMNNVLRHVQLNALWRVACGVELARMFELPSPHCLTYGRTALIYCNEQPAVELLEIVAPEETFID